MKKHIIILVTAFFLISNLVIPTTVLAQEKGPPKPKEWKGEGTKIEFPSMPTPVSYTHLTLPTNREV